MSEYLEKNSDQHPHFADYLMAWDRPKLKKLVLKDKVINLEERKQQTDVSQEEIPF